MRKKILFIHENDAAIRLISAAWADRYRLIAARHAEEGVERLLGDDPDVILASADQAAVLMRLLKNYPQYAEVPVAVMYEDWDTHYLDRQVARALSMGDRVMA